IIPRFKISGDLLLVRQYRIIFEKYVIGFPAGLVDHGETIEKGALRELREETGYSGKIVSVSSMLSVHSALVHEMAYCAFIELDENTLPVEQSLEDSENIEVFRVKEKGLFSFFDQAAKHGDIISAGPWLVALTANWPKHPVSDV
ncbi:MAG: NUDIX hydrolase, partial [Pseudomonadota bacterium]